MIEERLEEQAGLYVLEALTPAERKDFEMAVSRSEELKALVADLRSVRDAVAGAVPPATPPPHVKQRILAELDARNRKETPAAAPLMSSSSATFQGFWLPWTITAVVVVLAVNWYMDRKDYQSVALLQHARIEDLNGLADSLRLATNNLQQTVITLTAESKVDDVRIALLSSPLTEFPKPVAVCLWDNQQQTGVFVAGNLRALTPDRDYQLWVVDPQYLTPVNAGIFQTDSRGGVRLHFRPDKTIGTADRFMVTTEPKGGSPTPTFKGMVLVGG